MRTISRLAAVAAFAIAPIPAPLCRADEARTPAEAPTQPARLVQPPGPPELAPFSPDFQAAMANSQLQTYRYTQLAEQATALRKLCETGFGPADLCPKTGMASGSPLASDRGDLPTVADIDGRAGNLRALLVLADGRRVAVTPGSILPDGSRVEAITGDAVRLSREDGSPDSLSFGAGLPLK
jgi:type IV pilus biogenesis protein PilP